MKSKLRKTSEIIIALIVCATLLFGAYIISDTIKTSDIVSTSYFLGFLLEGSSIDIVDIISDPNQRGVIEKYLQAIANAYVDMEFIPYNEAETFKAILAALNKDIVVDSFRYFGKDLIIKAHGNADGLSQFTAELVESQHFDRVEVVSYLADNMEIICYAKEIPAPRLLGEN